VLNDTRASNVHADSRDRPSVALQSPLVTETRRDADFQAALATALNDRRMTGADLSRILGVSSAAVSLWLNSDSLTIKPDNVFAIERALELAPGSLSRLLGYLPVDAAPAVTPEEAIVADATLSDDARELLLGALRAARQFERR
jgi:transcriptional regulator with XRE-family HTH domain